MNASILQSEFAPRAVPYSGKLLLLQPDDAIALVRRASAERIVVLGVDAFFVRPEETISPLEHIVDFSTAVRDGDGSWQAAEHFINDRRHLGLVFEVVLGKHLDSAV